MISEFDRRELIRELIWRDRPAWIKKRWARDVIDDNWDNVLFWDFFWPPDCYCLGGVVDKLGASAMHEVVADFWGIVEAKIVEGL